MGPIGTETRLNPGCRLAIAVSDEVIRVPSGDSVVRLEVQVRHNMLVIPLEQRHLYTLPLCYQSRVSSGDSVVVFEVQVRHHILVIPLEQRNLYTRPLCYQSVGSN